MLSESGDSPIKKSPLHEMSAFQEPGVTNGDAMSVFQVEDMRLQACQPKRRGRVMTERRREQNRQAQKNHRARAKQKRILEEPLVEAQSQSPQQAHDPGSARRDTLESCFENSPVQDTCCLGDRSVIDATSGLVEPVLESGVLALHIPPQVTSAGFPWSEPETISGALNAETHQDIWNADTIPFCQPSLNFQPPAAKIIGHGIETPPDWRSFTESQTLPKDYISFEAQNVSSMPISGGLNTISDEIPILPSGNVNEIIAQNGFSIDQIIFAGLQSITETFNRASTISSSSTGNSSAPQGFQSTMPLSFTPSPSVTHLPLRHVALMAACLENAAHIGINVYEHIRRPKGHNELTPSPFYQSTFATTSLPQSILTELYDSVKPDLRPCSAQVKQPHPLYIDTLPFPSLRQRVLALRSCVTDLGDAGADGGEKIFDEEDFCRDIDADGIVCWGSDTDIGTGAPWDRRSWECRPWFLRKWWMVTGGPEGELGKQSRWWAEMRGEVFEEV